MYYDRFCIESWCELLYAYKYGLISITTDLYKYSFGIK